MHTLFLLNPTAGKTDCTQQLPQQINAAAARAGLAPEEYTIRITTHAGHARELARAAAAGAQQSRHLPEQTGNGEPCVRHKYSVQQSRHSKYHHI